MNLKNLKNLRLQNHLSQRDIANAVGIKENSYQRYEYGQSEPKLSIIAKLAEYYDVSIDYLVGRTDNPKINH